MIFAAEKVTAFVPELLKQSRPSHHLEPMVLLRYPDQKICVVTKDVRRDQNFLVSFVKPHKCITTSTISRWCVTVLRNGHNCVWITFD